VILKKIKIHTDKITLDRFLKWSGIVPTGGTSKRMVTMGEIKVNGVKEIRRSRSLKHGDQVEICGRGILFKVIQNEE